MDGCTHTLTSMAYANTRTYACSQSTRCDNDNDNDDRQKDRPKDNEHYSFSASHPTAGWLDYFVSSRLICSHLVSFRSIDQESKTEPSRAETKQHRKVVSPLPASQPASQSVSQSDRQSIRQAVRASERASDNARTRVWMRYLRRRDGRLVSSRPIFSPFPPSLQRPTGRQWTMDNGQQCALSLIFSSLLLSRLSSALQRFHHHRRRHHHQPRHFSIGKTDRQTERQLHHQRAPDGLTDRQTDAAS
ncbi:hypothetical protein IWX90DRAFT_169164 [Phyllosticta citrichinensis]|uniref:Uncharacterized protein n=1 Tax=Phyllosticta citrichinensis TaxID=1130410 RepID=A0ABR1Y1G5_9PEZI